MGAVHPGHPSNPLLPAKLDLAHVQLALGRRHQIHRQNGEGHLEHGRRQEEGWFSSRFLFFS